MRNTLGLLITDCTIRTSDTLLHSKFRGDVLWCQTEILRSFHVRWRQNKSGLWSSINLKQIKIQDNSHNSDNRSGWNFIPCSVIIFFLSLLLIVNIPSLAFRPQMHYIALVNFIGVLLNRAFRLQALTLRSKLPAYHHYAFSLGSSGAVLFRLSRDGLSSSQAMHTAAPKE